MHYSTSADGSRYNARMDWREHIVLDPAVCHGKATFRATRVLVSAVLGYLAAGRSEAEVLEDFPTLAPDSVRAALAYAADVVGAERVVAGGS